MTSREKLEKMLACEPLNDRREIAMFPQIMTWAGTCSGISQKEIVTDPDKFLEALAKTFATVGKPDVSMSQFPGDTIFIMGLPAKRPGFELGENDLYQFVETDQFVDEHEYDRILEMGWYPWYAQYMCRIQKPPFQSMDQFFGRMALLGANGGKVVGFLMSQGIEPMFHSALGPIFDTLFQIHSIMPFLTDLAMDPEKIADICNKFTPQITAQTLDTIKPFGGTRVGIFAMRSSATFISPDIFKEVCWPSLKQQIETFWENGVTSVIHADGNWLPMLETFLEAPKHSCHFEFDGDTDMFKAHEILGGHHSFRGDVPAAMLAFGTPDQVSEYCEKLIPLCLKGGVMLGSGCEVPKNAKLECVQAMMNSVR